MRYELYDLSLYNRHPSPEFVLVLNSGTLVKYFYNLGNETSMSGASLPDSVFRSTAIESHLDFL